MTRENVEDLADRIESIGSIPWEDFTMQDGEALFDAAKQLLGHIEELIRENAPQSDRHPGSGRC